MAFKPRELHSLFSFHVPHPTLRSGGMYVCACVFFHVKAYVSWCMYACSACLACAHIVSTHVRVHLLPESMVYVQLPSLSTSLVSGRPTRDAKTGLGLTW